MDELKFFAGLGAITLVVIGLFIYIGRKLSQAAETHASEIDLPLYITPTGTVFFAFVAAFLVYGAAIRVLAPASSFGEFLNTLDGVASILTGSILIVAVARSNSGETRLSHLEVEQRFLNWLFRLTEWPLADSSG